MDRLTVVLWVVAGLSLGISWLKGKERTLGSMQMARGMMKSMMGQIIAILFLIGLLLTFMPPQTIIRYMGETHIVLASVVAAVVGAITLIPAFVAFPLVGSFVDVGASIVPAVAFLTTLTMVGVVTFPLEKQAFGFKFAVARNGLSFLFAIIIALAMGVLM